MIRKPYERHAVMTVPARASAEIWRLALGLFVAALVMFGLARGVMALIASLVSDETALGLSAALQTAETPTGLLLLLFLMGAMGAGALVAAEVVHKRAARSLFGPARLFWRQFLRVLVVLVVLNAAIALLPPWPLAEATEPGLPPTQWLALLPLTLIGLLLQTGSEELLFRGYFQSQLAARLKHPAIWLTVPSAAFAIGHYAPETYGSNAFAIALWAFLFGVVAADLTARAGSLGPAIALHLVNNFVAIALVAMQGDMSGLALMQLPFGPDDEAAVAAWLPVDLATMGVSWLAARLAIRT
ncbi:CPBP family intramembrane glutamic endopeptidase [Sagittula salina]|uniref:CPBP family intramembrane metalloprotease n=1 Tax=Sagittula salina TaxID=2820268 RepID=A0A940MQK2_9RHOB|nr:CPBP family intramembrane glutamic endopeptidase [Sagittula salina]MBP0483157.1 CPBP family intramembrane metalloprotease [Sagittula salina]